MATDQEEASFVKEYAGLVERVARQALVQLALTCDIDDLIGYGYMGLMEAKSRFDPSKGVPFQSFAYYRIRGAILDGVRQMAYLPRRAHARLRAAELADQEAEGLQESRAQQPSTQPASDAAAQAASTLDAILGRMAVAYCVTLAAHEQDTGEASISPEATLIQKEGRDRVREAVSKLPDKERHLIEGHYLQGRPLFEVAAELGLSTSWGSRLQSRGLSMLRRSLRDGAP